VPREIKRKCVTMSTRLGVGQFGEVLKGELDESSMGGVPSYLVCEVVSYFTFFFPSIFFFQSQLSKSLHGLGSSVTQLKRQKVAEKSVLRWRN
jgi:hypothetical protein